jgi:hypothetical protein
MKRMSSPLVLAHLFEEHASSLKRGMVFAGKEQLG